MHVQLLVRVLQILCCLCGAKDVVLKHGNLIVHSFDLSLELFGIMLNIDSC